MRNFFPVELPVSEALCFELMNDALLPKNNSQKKWKNTGEKVMGSVLKN